MFPYPEGDALVVLQSVPEWHCTQGAGSVPSPTWQGGCRPPCTGCKPTPNACSKIFFISLQRDILLLFLSMAFPSAIYAHLGLSPFCLLKASTCGLSICRSALQGCSPQNVLIMLYSHFAGQCFTLILPSVHD